MCQSLLPWLYSFLSSQGLQASEANDLIRINILSYRVERRSFEGWLKGSSGNMSITTSFELNRRTALLVPVSLVCFQSHAARDYRSDMTTIEGPCVCDRVVSSYTPSLLVYSYMWMVGDDIASTISGLFYEKLGRSGDTINWDTVVQALDEAVCDLRRHGVPPLLWGAFAHSGP